MVTPTSVVALFCEDIREEKSGAYSLMGVMGDNVGMLPPPADHESAVPIIPRIFIYVRISFDVAAEIPAPIRIDLRMPDGSLKHAADIEEPIIAAARDTKEKGNPVAGIFCRIQMGGPMPGLPGHIVVEATIGSQVYVAGSVNFELVEDPATSSTTVSPPPS
jgi:hypothetical protein